MRQIKNCKTKKKIKNFCRHVIFAAFALQRAFIVKNFIWYRKSCRLYEVSAL